MTEYAPRQWTNMQKSAWGEGPWQNEPDKMQWVDDATGLDCLIVRNRLGGLCGYVGLPSDHPVRDGRYDEVMFDLPVDVHGGITFSGACDEDVTEGEGICHVPYPGRDDDIFWVGFDCGHAWDVQPGLAAMSREIDAAFDIAGIGGGDREYRDVAYVQDEIRSLAKQLAEIA